MHRKITHIILGLYLLVSTTGVTLSLHYCGGELISTSINEEAESCCDGTGGCCENTTLHFEVKDDYVIVTQIENTKNVELDILFPILFALHFEFRPSAEKAEVAFFDSSPPLIIQTRLSLLQTYLC